MSEKAVTPTKVSGKASALSNVSGAKSPPKSPSKSSGAKTPVPASPKKEEAKPVEEVAPTPVVIDPRSVKTLNTI